MIADGISPLNPEKAQIVASKIFLNQIKDKIAKQADFSFETTLSGKSHLKLITRLTNDNWDVVLFYLWIPSVEFSSQRVKLRVEQGGHNIPEDAIQRRYSRSLKNLIHNFLPICSAVRCLDNSGLNPTVIFEKDNNGISVLNESIYKNIMEVANG